MAALQEDSPKIRTIQNADVFNGLIDYLTSILNIKVSEDSCDVDFEKQMGLILILIRDQFGSLTIPEVQEAFKMYVARALPVKVFRLLDCISVGEVLSAYIDYRNESLRVYADQKRKLKQQSQLPTMTDAAKREIMDGAIERMFAHFKETKTIDEPFTHVFDELLERGIIKNSTTPALQKYYIDKLQEAEAEVKRELKATSSTDKGERQTIKEELKKITDGNSDKVQVRAKRIVLAEFFTKHEALGTDLKTIL